MNEKVSVVVPIYNIENEVGICIESICNQSYTNLEIILVDDGSTDSSGAICDKYAEQDHRIQVVHQSNQGLVGARKSGIARATGDYIVNVDGDDWIERNMVEALLSSIMKYSADIVQCNYICEGKQSYTYRWNESIIKLDENICRDIFEAMLQNKDIFSAFIWNKMYKTNVFRQAYFDVPDEMSYGEDYCAFLSYIRPDITIASVDQVLYHYRIRSESVSRAKNGIERILKQNRLTDYMYHTLCQKNRGLDMNLLENWVLRQIITRIRSDISDQIIHISYYKIKDIHMLKGKKVVVYGAGKVGRDYINQLSEFEQIIISGWIDKNYEKYTFDFRDVLPVEKIVNMEYDYIIVAVWDDEQRAKICGELSERFGIEQNKIMQPKPERII